MRYSKEKLVEDAKFVVSECIRFQELVNLGSFKTIERIDHMASLPHPKGYGEMICGAAAAKIITRFAQEAAERGGLSKRVTLDNVRKKLAELFVLRFFKEKRDIDTKQIDRLFNSTVKASKTFVESITHLIPCHLMNSKEPESFTLGPVKFHNRLSITRKILSNRTTNTCSKDTDQGRHERYLLVKAIRYYRNFRWVAEVTISECDRPTSGRVAEEAVTSALNCLHLLLGVANSSRMQLGGLDVKGDSRAKLSIGKNGVLDPSLSFAYMGEVTYRDGWSEMLSTPRTLYWKNIFDVALEVTTDPDCDRPISRRFIDAAQWFGEAARDTSQATKIVKYVTSLERMLMTEERDDISSLVSQRVAALCFSPEVRREKWLNRTRAAYDLRSRLVHGSISPAALDLDEGAFNAGQVAEMALTRAIEAFGVEGLRHGRLKSDQLAKWFGAYMKWADKNEEAMLAQITRNSDGAEPS
ncbi:hypothetical protein WR25_02503 [Diploscapter pachys]|jgi:hypothetical protein|uniref:Uncharacterized protein n=1 Tax=Diploscapter pachys TaxID=2018661 RepID=A0A2A2K2B0_9BILA|nr:hypothetical protein WR25_02503 [Diploscapter pachys]